RLWLVLLALGIGLSSLQIIPTFELIVDSARSSQPYAFLVENLLLQPKQLVGFISPDFFGNPATRNYLLTNSYPGNALYIGLIPFIFSLFSLVLFRKNSLIKFFSLTSLIIILFIVRNPITEILYKIQIPFFSTSSPKNAIFLLSFALSILAGYGLEYWSKDKGQLFKKILFIFGGIFVLCWLLVIATHPAFSSKNFLYSTALFGVLSVLILIGKAIGKRTIMAVLILITVLDLFYFLQKFNPFVSPKLVFPPAQIINFLQQEGGIDRFWGYDTARIEANFATQHQIFSPDGYDPLYPRWYGEFIQSSRDGKIATQFTNQTRSDANIVPGFGQEDLAKNLYRLRMLDILGVKYVLDRVESGTSEITFPTDRFKIIYQDSIWRVFENKRRAPRAFLTADYKIFNNKEEFERLFFDPNFDVAKTLLLEQVPAENLAVDEMSQAKVISYSPNKLLLAVKSRTSQLLFLSDAYYPGWKAFIDGVEKKIYRADYAFRAVVVPSGEHQVKFIYEPQSFSLGVKTSIISLVLLLVLAFWRRRKTYEG
ncbi:YfhO family protein, partial [Candidatus Daviesbacteria bacterium]|nr:YfhO family protein [Candidatus Daviesbacteria bacterium]